MPIISLTGGAIMPFHRSRTSFGIKCNDTRDIDPYELKLVRVGHYLWTLYKQECGKSRSLPESGPLWESLQTVWRIKREYRAELAKQIAQKSKTLNDIFRKG